MVKKIVIALRSREDGAWPKKVVRGRLTVLGVAVDENSTPWSFNRESRGRGFAAIDDAGRDWVLNLERCKVRTEFKLDGSIDSVIVEAR